MSHDSDILDIAVSPNNEQVAFGQKQGLRFWKTTQDAIVEE